MTKKKIIKRGILITVLSAAVIFAAVFAHYYFTTMSPDECKEYCIENTQRNATDFVVFSDGRYIESYIYYVAADGDSSKAQELFIFKRKYFGPLARYEFIMSSTQSGREGEEKFGSVQFFTINDDGEKDTDSTLLFFGSKKDSDISTYEYTLTVKEGSNVYSGNVQNYHSIWYVRFCGLNNTDEDYKKVISDVKFYDSKGNLVGVY